MPVTDRREPAVYVTIEDASYVAPTTEIGRIGYTVILGDRGPHNRIVKVTSQKQFQQIFGKPNFRRCSQTFYMADKYLEYSGNLLVVRVVPDASNLSLLQTEDPYQIFSYWSNVSIVENTPVNTSDEFTFTLTSATVLASSEEAYNEVNVGDYIYHIDDAPIYATLITDKTATTDPISHVTTYSITLTSAYQGGGSITTPRTALARLITSPPVLTTGTYTITAGSTDEIICTDEYAYNEVNVGNWIYKNGDTIDLARQVYSKSAITDTNGTTVYKLVLDQSYETVGSLVNLVKYAPYVEHSKQYIDAEDEMDPASATTVYYFYAIGAGAYYNDIRIKGVRNIELERMYTDADGLAKYKYIFMDIAVYYIDGDGNEKLLEGPWSVSLIQRTPENVVIRDISSGSELYIENVINENSNYIKCVAGTAVENLITSSDAEDRRLQVMLQLSQSNPIGVNNISGNGILLQNGTDGELYDSSGNINPTGRIMGMVSQAYEGAMISIDGSVEQIREVVYPLYQPDYIICGGYPATVQAGANALSAYRQDCMCLADTGGKKVTYTQDITARRDSVSWNNWASMIYTQYRYMFDQYTGRKYWFSPVYHALQRHLIVDAA